MTKYPLIVVAGATASGKTELAIELAEKFNGEIASADSMQIYKYMDIGTAKPTAEERHRAVHHLIDYVDPRDSYSAAEYTEAAHKCVFDILSRGKLPIMCGGTGLYISSVVNDVSFGEEQGDVKLRRELFKIAETEGNEALHDMLLEIDPESAAAIHMNNVKRVVRAIEFYKTTGMKISEHKENTKKTESRYFPVMLMIDRDRAELYDRINKRVDIMLKSGLADEVKGLMAMGCTRDMQSMQGIGYKEVMDCIEGRINPDELAETLKLNSRHYAKRQLTWFRREERIKPLDASGDILSEAAETIKNSGALDMLKNIEL